MHSLGLSLDFYTVLKNVKCIKKIYLTANHICHVNIMDKADMMAPNGVGHILSNYRPCTGHHSCTYIYKITKKWLLAVEPIGKNNVT